ncbi:hypothetical protein SK128_016798, partial [Halocaridina rubra]
FSWFSLCEYVIASCNMLYHVSVALDFSDEHLIVGHICTSSSTPSSSSNSLMTSSSSFQRSFATPTTCDDGNDSSFTRNGCLDDTLLVGSNAVVAGPQPTHSSLSAPPGVMMATTHPIISSGKGVSVDKHDTGIIVASKGTAGAITGFGGSENSVPGRDLNTQPIGRGGGGGQGESETLSTVIHQVLNTIPEGSEPLSVSQPCINGPAEGDIGLVHRRTTHNSQSPDDNPLDRHAHSE